jgi:arginine decarboxylase
VWFQTTQVVLTAGTAQGTEPLNAFDYALREAGIADFNLIKVTSIVPPGIPVRKLRDGSAPVLGQGTLVPTIYTSHESDTVDRGIAAAVGVGIPESARNEAGLVYVWSGEGDASDAKAQIAAMVADGMKVRGVARYETKLAVSAARVSEPWTSVLAAAIFCDTDIDLLFSPDVMTDG